MSTGQASVGHRESRSGVVSGEGRRRPRWTVPAAMLLAVCVSASSAGPAFGEGSVDFNTGEDTRKRNMLVMAGDAQSLAESKNRYSVLRVYARAGETIQMGSSAMGLTGGADQDNILVYAPGTDFASATDPAARAPFPTDPVFATDIFDCNSDDLGPGRIASRAQELAGPEPSAGDADPATWAACEFTAPADGIYPIIMMPLSPASGTLPNPFGFPTSVGSPAVGTEQNAMISIWDVTVRDSGGVVQPGRLFSHRLSLRELSGTTLRPNPAGYLYTPAGYQYRVSLFNHQGQAWEMAANATGVLDAISGERTFASFQWGGSDSAGDNTQVHFEAVAPQITDPDLTQDSKYPIFFRPVDPVAISGPGGLGETRGFAATPVSPSGALAGLAFTGAGGEQGGTAQGSGGTIRFDSPVQMEGLGYTVELDLNQNGTFGDGNDVLDDTGDLNTAGGNTFAWNGQDANGATPACGSYAYRVRATLAEAHFTMSDVENSGGTQIERLSLPDDLALGDRFAANYNDIDPYKGTAITNASPSASLPNATSGPTFHAWTANTGNADFVDTWMRLPEVVSSGTLQICPPPPPPPGDVSIDKRASDGRVTVGETVTYRLVAKNNSAGQADGVVVEDRVPTKLDVRGASSTQGNCTVTGNRVRCEIGTLAPGAEATVTVRAVATEAGASTNTGVVIAERCPAGQCDTDPARVKIVKPKLRLAKVANERRVRAGDVLSYRIRVTNPSKAAVRNVRTCDLMPAGLVPVRATPKVKVSKGRYCWTAKRLGAGKSKTYEITVRALPGAAGRTVNRASTSSGAVRGTARAARAVKVLPRQVTGGGVTG